MVIGLLEKNTVTAKPGQSKVPGRSRQSKSDKP